MLFLFLTFDIAFSLTIPDRVQIQSSSCSLWQKNGEWKNSTDGNTFATWTQECKAIGVADVNVPGFGRTDEQQTALLPTIRIRNAVNDNIEAIFTETLTSTVLRNNFLAQYNFKDSSDTFIGETTQMNLFDRQITVQDNNNVIVAQATQSALNTVYQSICVSDGYWDVEFMSCSNSTLCDNHSRWWILAMITVKAVRDMSRDSDGKPTHSLCQYVYLAEILMAVLIPIGVSVLVGVSIYAYCKKNSDTKCCNKSK